jgi:hypothetical protein
MRIGIVGGMCRVEADLERLAKKAGHQLEFHDGQLRGPSAGALESLIGRADVVVLVTEINSHSAVLRAKDILRRKGRQAMFLRKATRSRLVQLLDELGSGPQAPVAHAC